MQSKGGKNAMQDEFISKIGVYGQMHYRYLREAYCCETCKLVQFEY